MTFVCVRVRANVLWIKRHNIQIPIVVVIGPGQP